MPEGDAVHRIAHTFSALFGGKTCEVTSPQGRFASSAARIDRHALVAVRAVGKHMFAAFAPAERVAQLREEIRRAESAYDEALRADVRQRGCRARLRTEERGGASLDEQTAGAHADGVHAAPGASPVTDALLGEEHLGEAVKDRVRLAVDAREVLVGASPVWAHENFPHAEELQWLHIHLGLYGSWRFDADDRVSSAPPSIGAPRTNWVATKGHRHAALKWASYAEDSLYIEDNLASGAVQGEGEEWQAPDPVGQVRVRVLCESAVADVTGPNRCELMTDDERMAAEAKLGPDPLQAGAPTNPELRERFVTSIRSRGRAVGELIMDQSLVAGVGNIYRAEALYVAGISPMRAGNRLSVARINALWDTICELMNRGLAIGRIDTIRPEDIPDPLPEGDEELARWYAYHRTGRPCMKCGGKIAEKLMQNRRLFWCPTCQK